MFSLADASFAFECFFNRLCIQSMPSVKVLVRPHQTHAFPALINYITYVAVIPMN